MIKINVIISQNNSLFKNFGNLFTIILALLYKVQPIIPPIVFNIISSISAVLPIQLCANSIADDTIIERMAVIYIFLFFV